MMHVETNGTHVRERATIIPRAPHPDGQGACSEREPCVECAAAYASEDEHDVSGPEEYYALDFDAADEAYQMYREAMKACGREEEV